MAVLLAPPGSLQDSLHSPDNCGCPRGFSLHVLPLHRVRALYPRNPSSSSSSSPPPRDQTHVCHDACLLLRLFLFLDDLFDLVLVLVLFLRKVFLVYGAPTFKPLGWTRAPRSTGLGHMHMHGVGPRARVARRQAAEHCYGCLNDVGNTGVRTKRRPPTSARGSAQS